MPVAGGSSPCALSRTDLGARRALGLFASVASGGIGLVGQPALPVGEYRRGRDEAPDQEQRHLLLQQLDSHLVLLDTVCE